MPCSAKETPICGSGGSLIRPMVRPCRRRRLPSVRSWRSIKAEFTDEIGKPVWTSFSGLSNGRRVTASALVKLTPVLAPQLDHHLRVVVPFIDLDVAGEPSVAALAALNQIVDDVRVTTRQIGIAGRLRDRARDEDLALLRRFADHGGGADQGGLRGVAPRQGEEFVDGGCALEHRRSPSSVTRLGVERPSVECWSSSVGSRGDRPTPARGRVRPRHDADQHGAGIRGQPDRLGRRDGCRVSRR